MSTDGAPDRMDAWLIADEPEAWDDFVRWVWQQCTRGGADDLGLPAPPDVDAALLALTDHLFDCPGERCLTCALSDMAQRCPDCGDFAVPAWRTVGHVVVPWDVPTARTGEADNFPTVGVGCHGTLSPALRTLARDR